MKTSIHAPIVINPNDIPWKKIAPGVTMKDLAFDKPKNQRLTLFKFNKGARLKTHKHSALEWMYVLDGIYQDEFCTIPKGRLKINKKGSIHTSQPKRGCTLLVVWSGKHITVR
ncbi:cupin domain-containing protein [Candidatus Uhrbacteria bacterium]|nr:cupin domain-containing protein [Candidatus Uhrbacteria bacterium]